MKSGGSTFLADDVEAGAGKWQAAGDGEFAISTGIETKLGDRYYLAENRVYVGYDATLKTGPYQFDSSITAPDHVEHFPFQDGLLVWAVDDEAYSDNNTSEHVGHGLALPVDSHPAKFMYSDGTAPGYRRQPFDATFGLQTMPMDAVTLHKEVWVGKGKNKTVDTPEAVGSDGTAYQDPTFTDDDPLAFLDESNPLGGVEVAGHGVAVKVTGQIEEGAMTVEVTNP